MKSIRTIAGVALMCLIFVQLAHGEPFSDKTDIIYKKPDGTMPEEGTGEVIRIVEETFDSIAVELKIGKITIPSKDVDRIEHFDAPDAFKLALASIQAKDFGQAVKYLDGIKSGEDDRAWIKVYVMFYKAEALREWGISNKQKNAEAVALYEKFLSTHKESVFKAKAMLGGAIASVQDGKYDTARNKLEKIKAELFGTRWETMADIWLAKIHEKKGEHDRAASIYRRIAARDDEDPEMKREAQFGEIKCLASQKKYDRALTKADALVEEGGDPRVLGGVWNVKGDCYMASAGEGGQDQIKRALLAYLRVVVVYFFDSQSAAEAAFKAGDCFERLKQPARAIEQYRRAVETAGGGDWIEKAKGRLKELE